jgi:3-deoxy-manno-octulosonate cytidylyltransferase (CMP-KDO synthetase)
LKADETHPEAATVTASVVIPARYGSTRFPAKILASETGRPLVQHVVDQVRHCHRVRKIIVATDDARIVDALTPFDTDCVLTSAAHHSGTDRVAEVAAGLPDDIIVNVQGDEPEIEPHVIDLLITRMAISGDDMATAATPFAPHMRPDDPNLVKVVTDVDGRAVYFSRSPIPYHRDAADPVPGYMLHLGIYAYRRSFLLQFARLSQTPLEKAEKLEQLRAVEHGKRIYVLNVDRATSGIDTPEQYAAFVARNRTSITHK